MTELEERILKAYEEQGNIVEVKTFFDEISTEDMTRSELELFCTFLAHEFMTKNPIIEVSLKLRENNG